MTNQASTLESSVLGTTTDITRNARRAVREALMDHKARGNSIAVWEDDHVVIIPAEEIVIPPEA